MKISVFTCFSNKRTDANFLRIEVTNSITNHRGKHITRPEDILFFVIATITNRHVIVKNGQATNSGGFAIVKLTIKHGVGDVEGNGHFQEKCIELGENCGQFSVMPRTIDQTGVFISCAQNARRALDALLKTRSLRIVSPFIITL